jgi:shikimate kinase/3-dehydroquinate synthase
MLVSAGLPARLEGTNVDAVIYATGRDKKRTGSGPVPFVLCPEPGRATTGQTVDPAELRGAVQELIAS